MRLFLQSFFEDFWPVSWNAVTGVACWNAAGGEASGSDDLAAHEVKTGITDGAYTEVLGGLKAGDKVVVAVLSGTSTKTAGRGFGGPTH